MAGESYSLNAKQTVRYSLLAFVNQISAEPSIFTLINFMHAIFIFRTGCNQS